MVKTAKEKHQAGQSVFYEFGAQDNDLKDIVKDKYPGLDMSKFWSLNDTVYLPLPPKVGFYKTNVARPYQPGLGALYCNVNHLTLEQLAAQFGVSVDALKSFNEELLGKNPSRASKPAKLYIPNKVAFPRNASNPEGIDGPELEAPESGDEGAGN